MRSSDKNNRTRTESTGMNLRMLFNIGALLAVLFTVYVSYRAIISGRGFLVIGFLALFAGLLFESFRISENRRWVIGFFIICFFASLLYFLPRKGEEIYHFENHIRIWPYFLCIIFTMAFGTFYKDEVTAKLHEGITLLLSLSAVYWICEHGIERINGISILILPIVLIFSLFSIIHAVTRINLSNRVRLILSVWSTFIVLAFAVDNIVSVYRNQEVLPVTMWNGLEIGLQYFFLGVSAVYVMQNYQMLAAFMPSKKKNYKEQIKKNKEDHLNRYSKEQAKIGHSLFCLLFAGAIYWVNIIYKFLPPYTAIWLVLFTVPIILQVAAQLNKQKLSDKNDKL